VSLEPSGGAPGLVDLVRDLMDAHQMTRRVFARYRRGELGFDEVQRLVWDTEDAVLYRLKERSHGLFRNGRAESDPTMRREALFDLTVGSLFHEAMKFRENFYQRSVYGPKVTELRNQAGSEGGELFREFEKILAASSVRLDEAVQETEALLAQATAQLRVLLRGQRSGLVARYLIAHALQAEQVFEQSLDDLLADLFGSAGEAFRLAARSLLASGYFAEGREALREAARRGGGDPELARLDGYAEGMAAFLEGRYREALDGLARWLEARPGASEARFAELAHAALSRVPQLLEGEAGQRLGARAARLAERVAALSRAPGRGQPAGAGAEGRDR
jgi:hypothetical protein